MSAVAVRAVRKCARCSGNIDPFKRGDARTCSDRCRVALNRAEKQGLPPRAPRRTLPVAALAQPTFTATEHREPGLCECDRAIPEWWAGVGLMCLKCGHRTPRSRLAA